MHKGEEEGDHERGASRSWSHHQNQKESKTWGEGTKKRQLLWVVSVKE
jgi:hypothetical protein